MGNRATKNAVTNKTVKFIVRSLGAASLATIGCVVSGLTAPIAVPIASVIVVVAVGREVAETCYAEDGGEEKGVVSQPIKWTRRLTLAASLVAGGMHLVCPGWALCFGVIQCGWWIAEFALARHVPAHKMTNSDMLLYGADVALACAGFGIGWWEIIHHLHHAFTIAWALDNVLAIVSGLLEVGKCGVEFRHIISHARAHCDPKVVKDKIL